MSLLSLPLHFTTMPTGFITGGAAGVRPRGAKQHAFLWRQKRTADTVAKRTDNTAPTTAPMLIVTIVVVVVVGDATTEIDCALAVFGVQVPSEGMLTKDMKGVPVQSVVPEYTLYV